MALLSIKTVLKALGVEGDLLAQSLLYCRILLPFIPLFMLQFMFQGFMITAERPKLSMFITISAGLMNIILDALFIIVCRWGLVGAAWATVASQIVGGLIPLLYFAFPNSSPLRLVKTKFYAGALLKACSNGISEFLGHISMSVVSILYNYQLLRIAGEDGVVAFGALLYINFVFVSVFIGFSIGSNPIVSYHYGANDKAELKSLLQKNVTFIGITAVILTILAELSAPALAHIFVSYDAKLLQMTIFAFRIYAISFLFAGFNIYASAFFTALNNGLASAIISVVRTLICECASVMILPIFFGLTGIWSAVIVAEVTALSVSIFLLLKQRNRYGYFQHGWSAGTAGAVS